MGRLRHSVPGQELRRHVRSRHREAQAQPEVDAVLPDRLAANPVQARKGRHLQHAKAEDRTEAEIPLLENDHGQNRVQNNLPLSTPHKICKGFERGGEALLECVRA